MEDAEEVDAAGESDMFAMPRGRRHPPGTWKVWESKWFYATQTAGWIDVKMWMKNHLRNEFEGMGREFMSKTLRPHHFADPLPAPQRTILLLRAWAVWRARWRGWARAESSRLREVECMEADLEKDIRLYSAAEGVALAQPLLGSDEAHKRLVLWSSSSLLERLMST